MIPAPHFAGPAACELIDEARAEAAASAPSALLDRGLFEPAREFLGRPGKALRARVVEIAWSLAGGAPGACPRELPLLLEIVHAGSLIVDDVEDGSGERRGAAALHRVYGVPIAVNTGNWMYFWGLTLLSRMDLEPARELQIHRLAARSLERCHRGQALDLSVDVTQIARARVPEVVRAATLLKTGTLLNLGAASAAVAAGAPAERAAELGAIGADLGLGLQMLDDLGAVMSDARRAKGDEDLRSRRPTWPWAWLAEDLEERNFERLRGLARRVAGGADAGLLITILRRHLAGARRRRVRSHWERLLARLEEFSDSPEDLAAARGLIGRLETSYG